MFKKLKDKIAEEVKSSPQRVQQLAQGVQAVVQGATGTSPVQNDDSLFTLTEGSDRDDSFSSVSLRNAASPSYKLRRNSNSSIASDVSFLPAFESHANLYHLQSDLDASASEIEDSYSGQLEKVSKEQLLQAFRRMQMKYNKYRGRYTDLANHYRSLERENARVKSVLVETQDKALRRVSELKEQCSLEQSAKAHMENVLREDLTEKQYLIDTLHTKIQLLQRPSVSEQLVSLHADPETIQKELDDLKLKENDNIVTFEALISEERNQKQQLAVAISKIELQLETFKADSMSKEEEVTSLKLKSEELTATILQLRDNKTQLETEVNDLRKQVTNLKEVLKNQTDQLEQQEIVRQSAVDDEDVELSKRLQRITELEDSMRDQDNEIKNARAELANDMKRIETYELKQVELITSLEVQKAQEQHSADLNATLQKKIDEMAKKRDKLISEKQKEINKLKVINATNETRLANIEDSITTKEAQLIALQKQHTNEAVCNKQLIEELNLRITDKNVEIQALKEELDKHVKLSQEITDKNSEIMRLQHVVNINRQDNEEIQIMKDEEIHELQSKIKETQTALETVNGELNEKRIQLLESDEKCTENREKYMTAERGMMETINKLQEKLQERDEEVKNQEENNNRLNEEITHLKETLEQITSQMETLLNEKQLFCEEMKLKEQRNETKVKIEEQHFNEHLKEYEHKLDKVTKEKELLNEKIKQIQLQMEQAQDEAISKVKEHFGNRLIEAESKLCAVVKKNELLNEDIEKVISTNEEEKNKSIRSTEEQFEERLKEITNKLNDVTNQKELIDEQMQHARMMIEKQNEDSRAAEGRMNTELKEAQNKLEYMTREKDLLIEQIKEITIKIAAEEEKLGQMDSKHAETLIQLKEVMKQNEFLCAELKKINEEDNNWLKEREVLNKENISLRTELKDANSKLERMIHDKENVNQEMKITEQELETGMNGHENIEKETTMIGFETEIQELEAKVSLYENMELSAKESVQYLQNELDIMKNKNERLKSKLDETLVTLNHCADLSSSTEMEYLRNILYNYMIGKESVVLARVIAAVCKFDPAQTDNVLQKEQQKQTLLGQLGIL